MELNKENVDFIQGASNPIAVSKQLHQWTLEVYRKGGMDAVCNNALLKAVVGKLCSFYGIDHDGNVAYEYLKDKDL